MVWHPNSLGKKHAKKLRGIFPFDCVSRKKVTTTIQKKRKRQQQNRLKKVGDGQNLTNPILKPSLGHERYGQNLTNPILKPSLGHFKHERERSCSKEKKMTLQWQPL